MARFREKAAAAADNVAAAIVYTGLTVAGEKGATAASKVTEVLLGREFDAEGWRADQSDR